MQWRNSDTQFGTVTKTFHWVMALLVIGLLCVGLWMGTIPASELALKIKVYGLHKSIGISVLLLVFARIFWHLYAKKPSFVAGMKPWEKLAASAAHIFLYIAMLVMPLSGWTMSSAKGRSVEFFNLFKLPDLVAKNEALGKNLATLHWALAWALIAAITVHVLAALKHHFINKDITLKRMLPFG